MLEGMRRARLLLPLLLGLLAPAQAADLPLPYRYGFSPDGRYHLLLTAWTRDGSGLAAAGLRVVRQGVGVVLEDELTDAPAPTAETPSKAPEQLTEELLARHAEELHRLGLDAAPIPGRVLWAEAPARPQAGWPAPGAQRVELPKDAQSSVNVAELRPVASRNTCPTADMLPSEPLGLRLRVNGQDWFRDTIDLPAGRACIAAYRLETIWQYGDNIAVLLRGYEPGFEGPDARPITLLNRVPSVPAAVEGK